VTIVLLVFPVGLLLGGVPRSQAITAVLALLGGMLGAAWTGGLALPTAVEGSGAAAGLVAGVLLSRLVNRSVSRAVPPSGAAGH
jgi:membrane associated rhomboid family serine protease